MRSRYSAYVLGLEVYLLATWHVSTRPAVLDLAAKALFDQPRIHLFDRKINLRLRRRQQ